MMDINLSLLPTNKKIRLESIINFLFIKHITELFLIVVAVMTATLIWGWIVLEQDFVNLARTATLIQKESYNYNQDAKSINELIRNVNLASKKFSPLIPKLTDLSNTLPKDIKMNAIQINNDSQSIVLTGIAVSRSALLNYQEVLKKIPWIVSVETPVSQLFQKQDVKFEFQIKTKN